MQHALFSAIPAHTMLRKTLYIVIGILCLTPWVSAPMALFAGIMLGLTLGTPFQKINKLLSKQLLQISVVGLGFGMNLTESLKAGADGMWFTLISVGTVMITGILLGRWLHVSQRASYLIASGTAICGGSAIAAVGPLTRANDSEMSVSLATVFILNALALFIFPVAGHLLHLTQHQFGLWAAIAMHDTSSVVGAGAAYGEEALKVATTVKLTRALWIIPLSVVTSFVFKNKDSKISLPWFIFLFIAAMIINSYVHLPLPFTQFVVAGAHKCLTLTLFFIGAGLSVTTLKTVGCRPLLLGAGLWFLIAAVSLVFICFFV